MFLFDRFRSPEISFLDRSYKKRQARETVAVVTTRVGMGSGLIAQAHFSNTLNELFFYPRPSSNNYPNI